MNIPEIDLPVYNAMGLRFNVYENGDIEYGNIFLSDVLQYIRKLLKQEIESDYERNMNQFKKLSDESFEKVKRILVLWELSLPFYSQQSEETKAFIRSLV